MMINEIIKLVPLVLPVLGIILLLMFLASGYVKSPPDQAYVISGLGKKRMLIGIKQELKFRS